MKGDFTKGPIMRPMIKFAIPLAISFTLQNLYNMVDMIVVGRMVGENAIAAIGTTSGIFTLVLMLISGATMGMAVVVSQFFGAKDVTRVKKAASTSLYLIVSLSVFFSIVGFIFARALLTLIRTPAEVIDDATIYLRIIFAGSLATAMYNLASQLLRALGDSITPMIMLIISSVLHIGLNILLVGPFGLGVAGVGYSTVLATALSAAVCAVIAWRKLPILHPTRETIRPDREIAKMIVRIGIPSSLQTSTLSIGQIVVQSAVNGFGPTVSAAYGAATRIEAFFTYPPGGLTQAVQVFTGQNVGARQIDRVRKCFRQTLIIQESYHVISGIALIIFGKLLIGMFTKDGGDMVNIGFIYLIMSAIGALANGVRSITLATLNGSGDAAAAFQISIIELCGRIIGSFVLANIFGYVGVFLGTSIGWTAAGAFGLVRYLRGRWQNKGLVKESPAVEQKA